MDNSSDPETSGHFHKQGPVIDVHNLSRIHLGNVESDAEDVRIRLAEMNEARRDKKIGSRRKPERTCGRERKKQWNAFCQTLPVDTSHSGAG
jgi:hypothetical protein